MREKIEQLARGNFKYMLPKLIPSETQIAVSVESGSTVQGSFSIHNSEDSQMKGVLYSTSKRLILEQNYFVEKSPIINFMVNAKHLEPGIRLAEKISVITNCGEIEIPVLIQVEEPYIKTSVGTLRNISQLANLSKTSWEEACQVFKSDSFKNILSYFDKDKLPLYLGLKKSSSASQALDEFLVATRQKEAVKIRVNQQRFIYNEANEDFEDSFVIMTQEWGYLDISIVSNHDFVVPERKKVWAECFVNHELKVNFLVKAKGKKRGIHHAVILIETALQTIEVKVELHCIGERNESEQKKRKERKMTAQLTENYLKFRCETITLSEYVQHGELLLRQLGTLEHLSLTGLLYQIHFKLITNQVALASNMIFALEEKYEDVIEPLSEYYGVLLYLKTLCKQEDFYSASLRIKECLTCHPDSTILFWINLYLNPMLSENGERRYQELKNFMRANDNSPILYYEAAILAIKDPSILKKAEAFERKLFMFMIHRSMMTQEVMLRSIYLIEREKTTEKLNFLILKKIYEQYQISDALRGMLAVLIRSHQRTYQYHSYFEEGIKRQLRITELPEYYIYTMDESKYQRLPESILTYFSYHNNLPEGKRLYYYCCILENAHSNPELILEYHDEVLQFITYQILKQNKSPHLAVLCNAFLQEDDLNAKIAEALPQLSFYEEIDVKNTKMKAIAVSHKELEEERISPIIQGKSIIYKNTADSNLYFMDAKEQRYFVSVPYQTKERYQLDHLYPKMLEYAPNQYNLLLYCLTKGKMQQCETKSIEMEQKLIAFSELSNSYRKELWQHLIQYYYDNGKEELLESYLLHLDVRDLTYQQQSLVIEFMLIRKRYEEAIVIIQELGYEGIQPNLLLQLCTVEIKNSERRKELEPLLMEISYDCFLNKEYNEESLQYLSDGYNGTTIKMLQLWEVSQRKNVNVSELEERLLGQMLFAESYGEDAKKVFLSYYKKDCNRKLIMAYLAYYAYHYLLFDWVADDEVFEIIERDKIYENTSITLMALLKYYSKKKLLTAQEVNFVRYHMAQFQQKSIVLPFFQNFGAYMEIPSEIREKYFVEYRTDPKAEVTISYCINGMECCTEKMKNVYYGIFIQEFLLFEGDHIEYSILEQRKGEEKRSEKQSVRFTSCDHTSTNTNYDRLNQMIAAKEAKKEEALEQLLKEYALIECASTEIFHPL